MKAFKRQGSLSPSTDNLLGCSIADGVRVVRDCSKAEVYRVSKNDNRRKEATANSIYN